ncbi:MAG: T9SS type A sorting domain-containing protein [Bacteroidales bacterium]|nr:T9SS type A sorting domain-containing protein [Bacteroidales bacterium]
MKTTIRFKFWLKGMILFLMASAETGVAQIPMLPQQVIMGSGYANEIYYQFTTFNTSSAARNVWDISFMTMPESASILINDGTGATLWTYPYADISGWDAVDTIDLYTWPTMYNDPDNWENGAFNRNSSGYPDYGWGVYSPTTQIITGDSIFIMQLIDGSFKKVWIVEKNILDNAYVIRYANLDGSDFQEVSLDCDPFTGKVMVGLDMQVNIPVDYQPAKESWDILFTKYMAWHPTGAPVVVTGVLSNPAIVAKKFYPVDPEFNDWESAPWDSSRSTIGWDWKWFDFNAMSYLIEDSMLFYVKDQPTNVYRLRFTGFEGTSTGVIDFEIALSLSAGVDNSTSSNFSIKLFPNPAVSIVNMDIKTQNPVNDAISVSLRDMMGREILSERLAPGQHQLTWHIESLSPGPYMIIITSGSDRTVSKLFKL